MEKLNEGKKINLVRIDTIFIIIIINLVIHALFFKKWFDIGAKYKKIDR